MAKFCFQTKLNLSNKSSYFHTFSVIFHNEIQAEFDSQFYYSLNIPVELPSYRQISKGSTKYAFKFQGLS